MALVATVAVALSGWCYDPPKHTNAYTRAGVTFAQRGGMDASTYVVTNVTMNGNARMLPPYLYELDLDDTYPEDAEWYYAQADYSDGGGCSVRRNGNTVERNFDWKFDAAPTFVVRVNGSDDRFASVAVCNVGTNLTDEMVRSGTPSRFYKCIAGHATDGVNENGVFAEVNVVDGTWPRTSGTVHGLGAIRWAMDHGTNAQQVAEFLAANVYLPSGFGVNFHYMIADETATYIVEDGVAHPVTNAPAVMTNFKLYPKTQGAGWERYELLSDTANAITDAWFTRAYAEDTDWRSEFDSVAEMETAKEYWRNGSKESHRGQHVGNKWWWQSVHTSVYNLKARTLKIAVQEIADWYVFGLPASGSGKVKSVNGKVGEVTLHAEDVGAVPTVITNEVRVQLAEKLDILPNGSTNGLRLAVGGSGMVANVDGNVAFKVAGKRSLSDYGITNAIPQDADDVGALPDDQAQLETNENFRGAVATVSPPVVVPQKWSLTSVTNSDSTPVETATGFRFGTIDGITEAKPFIWIYSDIIQMIADGNEFLYLSPSGVRKKNSDGDTTVFWDNILTKTLADGYYDAKGAAGTAEANAKGYADQRDTTYFNSAKQYADGVGQSAEGYADRQDAVTLQGAKDYVDGKKMTKLETVDGSRYIDGNGYVWEPIGEQYTFKYTSIVSPMTKVDDTHWTGEYEGYPIRITYEDFVYTLELYREEFDEWFWLGDSVHYEPNTFPVYINNYTFNKTTSTDFHKTKEVAYKDDIIGMPTTGLVWSANAVKTSDGNRTIGAADVGALPVTDPVARVGYTDGFMVKDATNGTSIVKLIPNLDGSGRSAIARVGSNGFWTELLIPDNEHTKEIATRTATSLQSMLVDANTNETADCECISTNLCKLTHSNTVAVVNQTKALFAAGNTNLVLRLRTEWTPDGAAVFFDAFTNDVDAVIAR